MASLPLILCAIVLAWIAGRITEGTTLWGMVLSREAPSTTDTLIYVGVWIGSFAAAFAAVNHAYRSGLARGRADAATDAQG